MKNFYIQTIVLFFVVLAGFTSKSNAQFSNSDEVYCYQYVKSVGSEGVEGRESRLVGQIICVYFHDGRFVYLFFDTKDSKTLGLRLAEDSEFLLKMMKQRYYDYINHHVAESKPLNPNSPYNYHEIPFAFKYYQSLSTSSKNTYKSVKFQNSTETWRDPNSHVDNLWSFSLDKSNLIRWGEKSNQIHYHKLIDPNSLKPNLDFLD